MRDVLVEMLLIPRDAAVAAFDKLTGKRRKRYEETFFIKAPRELVWKTAGALSVISDTLTVGDVTICPHEEDCRLQVVTLRVDGEELKQTVRIVDERENEGYVLEIVANESDPRVVWGDEHYVGIALADAPGGTIMTQFAELTFTAPYARLLTPYTVRDIARRTKRLAEAKCACLPVPAKSARA